MGETPMTKAQKIMLETVFDGLKEYYPGLEHLTTTAKIAKQITFPDSGNNQNESYPIPPTRD